MANVSELIVSPFSKMDRAYIAEGAFELDQYAAWTVNGSGIVTSSFSGTVQLKGNSIIVFSRNKVTFSTGLLQYCAQIITYDSSAQADIFVSNNQSVKQNDDLFNNKSSTINWKIQYVPITKKDDLSIDSGGRGKSSVRTINDFLEGQSKYW